MTEAQSSSQEGTIATAPGDLPMPEVEARVATLASQFRHDNTIRPLAPRPDEPVEVSATSGIEIHLRHAVLFYTTDGSEPDIHAAAVPLHPSGLEWYPRAGFVTSWHATVPGQPSGTVVRYRIGGWSTATSLEANDGPDVWASDGQGFWFRFPGEQGITTFAYSPQSPAQPLPEWMNDAVIYHVFLDRFHPGTPNAEFGQDGGALSRHGGTIVGVRQALPYLVDLGVTCLWFSPLGPSETYHRYDTVDYFSVDPELGSAVDLRMLIHEAHEQGIRIWLDFVPSHSSWHHPAFLEAQRDSSAPTYSWYTFDEWPDNYRNFMQSSRYLPSLNTQDPGARAHLIDAAVYWISEFDVDGYRIDHVIAAGMDFWLALRQATEAAKDDVVLVGEATDTPDCLRRYRGHLHGILDFPLARALRLTFGAGTWSLEQLDSFLGAYELYMADGPGTVSFLDNHDMDRFLWVAGDDTDRLKMAALCQFSLHATPVVYYGTEIGMTQKEGAAQLGFGGDSEARSDMVWDESQWDHDLHAFYRSLIRVRRTEPTLQAGTRQTIHLNSLQNTYAYLLSPAEGQHDATRFLVAYNVSAETRQIRAELGNRSESAACVVATGLEPNIETFETSVTVSLSPMSAAIVRV